MNEPPSSDEKATREKELARIQAETSKAQAVLDRLHADVLHVRNHLEASRLSPLLGVNQQLVLKQLRHQIQEDEAARARQDSLRLEKEQHARALELLRGANEQLVIAAVTAQSLQSAAEVARRRQTDLLAVVAHELRHPLTPISNAASILARVSGDLPVVGRLQVIIEEQVVHMSRLVNDLLDVSRIDTGKLRLEMAPVDLTRLLGSAIDACRPVLNTRRQKLVTGALPSGLQATGDPVRLMQVLTNLLDNASKYTPEEGVISFTVAVMEGSVEI
ncbi:MAG: sensor histidine kinase, partial [Burkholderiales bacterium]